MGADVVIAGAVGAGYLPEQAKLVLCRDLETFIKRQERTLRDAGKGNRET
jgi:hypothetical protein